jgi:MFS family permease
MAAAGVGLLASNTPIYLSELVLPKHRARSVGFTIAATGAMSVIATTVVWASAKYNDRRQYQVPMAVQAAAPVVFGLLSLLIVESPSWLVGRGRIDEARQVLLSIMSQNIALVETELIALQLALQSSADLRASINVFDIFKREHIERTLTSGAPLSASQVGGQILTGTYATVILVQSGVADPFKMTIIIFMMQFVGALVGPPLVDKVGRRPVALVGFSILFIIDIAAGSLAAAGLTTSSRRLALASLCIIFGFFNSAAFQSM